MGGQAKIHNDLAPRIVVDILRETIGKGGKPEDALILTESVLVGVVLALVKLGGDEKVLDVMVTGARGRLAKIRLAKTAGNG